MKKVAILRRNGLGDLLCALPLVNYFKHKGDSVALFVDERNAPLIPFLPPIDEVIIFPKKGNKYWNVLRTASAHRKKKFDWAISAKTSPMKLANFFLFALGAKEKIAFSDQSWHCKLLNRPIPYFAEARHQALKSLRLVEPSWEEIPEHLYPTLSIPSAWDALCGCGPVTRLPTVLVSATTTRAASRLNPNRYAFLLNRLYEQHTFQVLIVGQPGSENRAQSIASGLKMKTNIYFPGQFEQFMVSLSQCHLFFVGDGGTAHIGAAMGKPVVVLFGGILPEEWAPLGKRVKWLYHPEHVDKLDEQCVYQALASQLKMI